MEEFWSVGSYRMTKYTVSMTNQMRVQITMKGAKMVEFIVGLVIGLFSGAAIGIGIMAVCAVGKRGNNSDNSI